MPSLQAYGIEKDTLSIGKTDDHHLLSSNQQPVTLEKSATSGVRQESSSEESSSADAFAPFLGSVWAFHYFYSDNESIGELIDTFTFASTVHMMESGLAAVYAVTDSSCYEKCFLGHTNNSSGGDLYLLYGFDLVTDPETFLSTGFSFQFSLICTTPICDTVIGRRDFWYWKDKPGTGGAFLSPPAYTSDIIGKRLSASSPSGQTNTSSNNTLPPLGGTTALDVNGTAIPTETIYSGGISINGGNYQTQVVQNLADKVDVLGNITVDPNHVGQAADIFVYAEATLPSSESVSYFTLGQDLSILPWDQDSAHLAAFQHVLLGPTQAVPIYQGTFFYPGTIKVFFGYRLEGGTIVTHDQPIDITINQ